MNHDVRADAHEQVGYGFLVGQLDPPTRDGSRCQRMLYPFLFQAGVVVVVEVVTADDVMTGIGQACSDVAADESCRAGDKGPDCAHRYAINLGARSGSAHCAAREASTFMLKVLLSIGGLQLATMLVLLSRTKFLAVFLGPEGVGLMAVVDKLLAVMVQTISLSLPYAALRFLPELWDSDRAECYRSFRAMSVTLGALALLATMAGVLLSLTVPAVWGAQLAAYPLLLVAAFLSVPAQAFAPFLQNTLAGTMRHRASMLFGVAHAVLQVTTGLIGVFLAGLTGLYVTYAAAAAALLAPALMRVAGALRPTPSPVSAGWRSAMLPARVLRFSLALFGLTLLAPFAALYAHYGVLDQGGAVAAGWMQAAMGIGLAVRGVLGSAHPVYLTPHINKGGSWQERMQWAARFQNIWCLIAGVLVPPLLLMASVAITVLYAPSFLPATQFVYLFVVAEVLAMLAGTYQGIIVAADRLRFHVAQNVTAQLIFIGVVWLTIPRWGIAGAAFGAIASYVFLFAASSAYLAWKLQLRPPWRTTALTAYLLVALVITGWIGSEGTRPTACFIAVALAAYLLVLGGLVAFLRRDERRSLCGWILGLRRFGTWS